MSRDRIGNSGQEMRAIFLARCFFEIFFVVVSLSSVFYFFFFFSIVRLILFTGYGIDCEFHGQLDFSARFRFYRDFVYRFTFYFALEESLHFRFKIQNGFEDIKLRNFVYSYTIIAKRLTKY